MIAKYGNESNIRKTNTSNGGDGYREDEYDSDDDADDADDDDDDDDDDVPVEVRRDCLFVAFEFDIVSGR